MDVRARFPLTLRCLGHAGPPATSVEGFVEAVCALHPKGDIPHRAVRDLARYEGLLTELEPIEPIGPMPGDKDRIVLSPRVRIVVYGAGLPGVLAAMRAQTPAAPKPARGWLVLWRDAKGHHERALEREDGWILESLREPTLVEDAVEDDEDRAIFARMWGDGWVVRA